MEVWGDQFVTGLLINDGQEFNFNERDGLQNRAFSKDLISTLECMYYSETVALKVDLVENADDDLFAERGSARQIIRSRWMIISFVAFMSSQSSVADPKSFPAEQM